MGAREQKVAIRVAVAAIVVFLLNAGLIWLIFYVAHLK